MRPARTPGATLSATRTPRPHACRLQRCCAPPTVPQLRTRTPHPKNARWQAVAHRGRCAAWPAQRSPVQQLGGNALPPRPGGGDRRQSQRRQGRLLASRGVRARHQSLLHAQALLPLHALSVRSALPGGSIVPHPGRSRAGGREAVHRLWILRAGLPLCSELRPIRCVNTGACMSTFTCASMMATERCMHACPVVTFTAYSDWPSQWSSESIHDARNGLQPCSGGANSTLVLKYMLQAIFNIWLWLIHRGATCCLQFRLVV